MSRKFVKMDFDVFNEHIISWKGDDDVPIIRAYKLHFSNKKAIYLKKYKTFYLQYK